MLNLQYRFPAQLSRQCLQKTAKASLWPRHDELSYLDPTFRLEAWEAAHNTPRWVFLRSKAEPADKLIRRGNIRSIQTWAWQAHDFVISIRILQPLHDILCTIWAIIINDNDLKRVRPAERTKVHSQQWGTGCKTIARPYKKILTYLLSRCLNISQTIRAILSLSLYVGSKMLYSGVLVRKELMPSGLIHERIS